MQTSNGERQKFYLSNVVYIPNFHVNIISSSRLKKYVNIIAEYAQIPISYICNIA